MSSYTLKFRVVWIDELNFWTRNYTNLNIRKLLDSKLSLIIILRE